MTYLISSNKQPRVLQISEFIEKLKEVKRCNIVKTGKKIEYYNIPAAFDIEVTSFYSKDENGELLKNGIMYIWTFAIYGLVTTGRTWKEFIDLLGTISDELKLYESRRLVIYVHNLAYEFQFMRKHFEWAKVFALEERKPVQAITPDGIEFRCSYKLSGYSLQKLGDQLTKYKVQKLVGDLDYDKVRHSKTVMTEKEVGYCVNDVMVVVAYIQELIESNGDISKIPLTKTGFVRRYCRKECLYTNDDKYHSKYKAYRSLMKALKLDADTYLQLKRAFAGGFTHANAFWAMGTAENVSSYDFTSSYPYVMISEKFPMSPPEHRKVESREQLDGYLKSYCCLFDCEFVNIRPNIEYENYISSSKCWGLKNGVFNNGRVVSADELHITITEQDFMIINKFYKWDKFRVSNFKTFRRGYLPTDFVKSIVHLYGLKTRLKGVSGKEVEYLRSKEDINSAYGMCVTDICREEITYGDEWSKDSPDLIEALSKANKSVKRFLYYPWGVWVTAYARANLFTGIVACGNDYIYADTDSVKIKNREAHLDYFERYNKIVTRKLQEAADYHKISFDELCPKTIEGKTKQLGVWDYEGTYTRFKTLGAKRYLVEYVDKKSRRLVLNMTVAGVNKKVAVPYLQETYSDVFEAFNEGLVIPAGKTGKLTLTYIDDERSGYITDYNGVRAHYHEMSGIHMEPCEYSFSLTEEYIKYILGIKETEL